jgi:hypothetical protein
MRFILAGLVVFSSLALADDINEKLPAGGVFVHKTKWDNIRVECTADPIEPKLLLSTCSCTSYYGYSSYVYRLSVVHTLSNGKQITTPLAEMISTLDTCYKLAKEQHREECRVR